MKLRLLILSLLIAAVCNAQSLPAGRTPLGFNQQVKFDTAVSAQELYRRAKLWLSDYYLDTKEILQTDDAMQGEIIVKPVFEYEGDGMGKADTRGVIHYTVKIHIRDNSYRIEVAGFVHDAMADFGQVQSFGLISEDAPNYTGAAHSWYHNVWQHLNKTCTDKAVEIIKSLQKVMKNPQGY